MKGNTLPVNCIIYSGFSFYFLVLLKIIFGENSEVLFLVTGFHFG